MSDAKFTLGDEFTVRGFKDSSISADRGAYISNTFQFPFEIGKYGIASAAPYVGYDVGTARDNCASGDNHCTTDYLMGAAIGLKASGRNFNTYLTLGWPLMAPERMNVSAHSINYKIEARF